MNHPKVGSALKSLLLRFFIEDRPGCNCDALAQMMDAEGPEWCQQNEELILDQMEREAERRGLFFTRNIGRWLLKLAVWKAKREATR